MWFNTLYTFDKNVSIWHPEIIKCICIFTPLDKNKLSSSDVKSSLDLFDTNIFQALLALKMALKIGFFEVYFVAFASLRTPF